MSQYCVFGQLVYVTSRIGQYRIVEEYTIRLKGIIICHLYSLWDPLRKPLAACGFCGVIFDFLRFDSSSGWTTKQVIPLYCWLACFGGLKSFGATFWRALWVFFEKKGATFVAVLFRWISSWTKRTEFFWWLSRHKKRGAIDQMGVWSETPKFAYKMSWFYQLGWQCRLATVKRFGN